MWRPSKPELEMIADWGFAQQSIEKMSLALGITPEEFRAWSASLVATRSAPLPEPPMPPPVAPAPKGHSPGRVLAERHFEAPVLAVQEHDSEDRGNDRD